MEFFIADFADAFHILHNKMEQRSFFVVLYHGHYLVFVKTVQGVQRCAIDLGAP